MTSVASSTHTVHRGETLSQIARDEGTSVHALLAENPGIHDANVIRTGQSLKLPDDRASNHQHHSSESRDTVHPSITAQLGAAPKAASTEHHLRRGDNNAAVGALKRDLQQMGYLTKADSSHLFGVRTERALKAFQHDIGISATGVSGPIASGNLDALAHGVGIGRNHKGEAAESIRAIQSKLFKLGYFDGHPLGGEKGDFGVRTQAAVKSFQKNEGLTVSGRVGSGTFAKLQTAKPDSGSGDLFKPMATRLDPGSSFNVPDGPEGAPANDGRHFHAAKDWFAPGGTTVRSPIDGKIVEVRPSRGNTGQVFGGVVKIQGQDGKVWVFRHIDPSSVSVGQKVSGGDRIGNVTNWLGGPSHTHIELWKTFSGGYDFENMLDPMIYLKKFL